MKMLIINRKISKGTYAIKFSPQGFIQICVLIMNLAHTGH